MPLALCTIFGKFTRVTQDDPIIVLIGILLEHKPEPLFTLESAFLDFTARSSAALLSCENLWAGI
jgi:hypothetical protein